jgi:putative phage-type endonuclease
MKTIFERYPFTSKEEWLSIRGLGIGGSDSSCVVGYNPYKTSLDLWKEKLGLVPPNFIDNKFTIYGKATEEHIRGIFQADYVDKIKVTHTDEVLVRKDKPYLRASLDGELEVLNDFEFMSYWKPYHSKDTDENIVPDPILLTEGMKGILEIKTTEVISSMHKEKWHNVIPMNYYCQVLHYLYVTGYDFVILRAQLKWKDTNNVMTLETRDYGFLRSTKERDIAYLENEVSNFYLENIVKKIEPSVKINI